MTQNPATSDKSSKYEPRDAAFYGLAAGAFAAALRPRGNHADDAALAKRTGHTLARALDRGIFPAGYVLPKSATVLARIQRRETLDAATSGRPLPGLPFAPGMTEGQKAQEAARLASEGPVPTREAALAENQKAIEGLADISEGVRNAAMLQTLLRLDALQDITGARETEALSILVEEVENAIENFREAGNPVRSIEHEPPGENGSRHVPYPGSLVVELLTAAMAAQEEDPTQQPAQQPLAEGGP